MGFRFGGHATVLVAGPPCVVVDPWRYRLGAAADLALVTHGHADHCSEDDLAEATSDEAWIVAPAHVATRLRGAFGERVRATLAGERLEIGGAGVTALPAEGPEQDGRPGGFHPRGSGLSYLLDVAGERHLFLGDSVALAEHEGLTPDVAYFAVGGLVTTGPDEAVECAARVGARLSVPVHWGDLDARFGAAQRFVALCAERGLAATVA